MDLNTLNLILLIFVLLLLFAYLFIRIWFSTKYVSFQVPIINSGNDVISNLDLSRVINYYQNVFRLQEYELKFEETDSLYNLDKGFNKQKKTITFSKIVFESVGYELDYVLATMWFISQKTIFKNKTIKAYSFINRYGFHLSLILVIIFALLSLAMYLLVGIAYNGIVDNSVLQFLWNVPLFQFLAFLAFLNGFVFYLILLKIKPTLESQYGKELSISFKENFKEYSFDLSVARNYASEVPLPHNFGFKTMTNQKFKWLGPFVKH